jgi:hypothetical protein
MLQIIAKNTSFAIFITPQMAKIAQILIACGVSAISQIGMFGIIGGA